MYDYLGFGFLESVYEKALMIKLMEQGLREETQKSIVVYFEEMVVGTFKADLIVEDCVIIELKAVEITHPKHEVQLVNYLRSTEIEVGLLINFGKQLEIKRKVFSNIRKRVEKRLPKT